MDDSFVGSRLDGCCMNDLPKSLLFSSLNLIPTHTWYADSSGGLAFVNQRCGDYLGLPDDHPLPRGIEHAGASDAQLDLLHPDDRESSRKAWAMAIESGIAFASTFRMRDAKGAYRWFASRAEPHLDES